MGPHLERNVHFRIEIARDYGTQNSKNCQRERGEALRAGSRPRHTRTGCTDDTPHRDTRAAEQTRHAPPKQDEHPEHRPRERHEQRQRARGAVEGVVVGDARCRRVPRSGEVGRTGPWARAAGGERVVEHQRRDCTGTCEYVHPPRTSHAASARGPKAESTRERAGESCR